MATYWISTNSTGDTNSGSSPAPGDARLTLEGGLNLLTTKGDILNIVNDGVYDWSLSANEVTKTTPLGTSFTDPAFTVRGRTAADAPAMVTVQANAGSGNAVRRILRLSYSAPNACGYVIFENIIFDASTLPNDPNTYTVVRTGIGTSDGTNVKPAMFRYCALIGGATGVLSGGSRYFSQAGSYGPAHQVTLSYCYVQNAHGVVNCSTNTLGVILNVDRLVSVYNGSTVRTLPVFQLGTIRGSAGVISVTHWTHYEITGNNTLAAPFDYQMSSDGAAGSIEAHSNIVYLDTTKSGAATNPFLKGSVTFIAQTFSPQVIGYNILLGGTNTDVSNLGAYGWYAGCFDSGSDTWTGDHVAYSVAPATVFADPATTYDWTLPNGLELTLLYDLRPILYTTDGYTGDTPGALEGASTDYTLTVVANKATANVGETIRYTVTVSNAGFDASSVVMSAAVPSGLTYVSHVAASGTYVGGVWTLTDLNDGVSTTLTIDVTVDTDQAGQTITFSVSITGAEPIPGIDTSDDTDSFDLHVRSTSRARHLDVEPIYAPDLQLEINSSLRGYINRVRRAYLRFDDERVRWREYATKQVVVGASATVDLTTGLEYYYYILLDSDQPVEVSVGPSGSDVFFPQCTKLLLAPTFAERIQVRNPGTTDASVTITVVDNGNTE